LTLYAKQVWGTPVVDEATIAKYKKNDTEADIQEYTIDTYEYLQGEMLELYELLRHRILNLDASVREEYKKLYIAFKTTTNFVDIVPQKSRLRLSINIPFSEINDPKGLCKDVTNMGRWGNGDVEVGISSADQIEDIMFLIRQSFEWQMEG